MVYHKFNLGRRHEECDFCPTESTGTNRHPCLEWVQLLSGCLNCLHWLPISCRSKFCEQITLFNMTGWWAAVTVWRECSAGWHIHSSLTYSAHCQTASWLCNLASLNVMICTSRLCTALVHVTCAVDVVYRESIVSGTGRQRRLLQSAGSCCASVSRPTDSRQGGQSSVVLRCPRTAISWWHWWVFNADDTDTQDSWEVVSWSVQTTW